MFSVAEPFFSHFLLKSHACRNRLKDIDYKLVVARGERGWEGTDREFEICRY